MVLAVSKLYYCMLTNAEFRLLTILLFILYRYIIVKENKQTNVDNTDLPADTRRQVLHNQTVFGAHWRRVPAENGMKKKHFGEAYVGGVGAVGLNRVRVDGADKKNPACRA